MIGRPRPAQGWSRLPWQQARTSSSPDAARLAIQRRRAGVDRRVGTPGVRLDRRRRHRYGVRGARLDQGWLCRTVASRTALRSGRMGALGAPGQAADQQTGECSTEEEGARASPCELTQLLHQLARLALLEEVGRLVGDSADLTGELRTDPGGLGLLRHLGELITDGTQALDCVVALGERVVVELVTGLVGELAS